jgi:hypothetical protein
MKPRRKLLKGSTKILDSISIDLSILDPDFQ